MAMIMIIVSVGSLKRADVYAKLVIGGGEKALLRSSSLTVFAKFSMLAAGSQLEKLQVN